jgi:hypothetical protein
MQNQLRDYRLSIRMKVAERDKLREDAKKLGLDISSYARMLILNHPDRNKEKGNSEPK